MPTIGNLGTMFVRDENGKLVPVPCIQGKNGITPHIGENGNWWIGETDTGALADNKKYPVSASVYETILTGKPSEYTLEILLKDGEMIRAKLPNMGLTPDDVVEIGIGEPSEFDDINYKQFYLDKKTGRLYINTSNMYPNSYITIGGVVLSGENDPTGGEAANINNLYINTTTGAIFLCVRMESFMPSEPPHPVWQQIGGTGGDVGTDITLGITGAVVGQTVKITEVDEDGRPVKWESADIPAKTDIDSTLSIEGSAADAKAVGDKLAEVSGAIENLPQPDWNQNDETAPDYVKNRPFYEETKEVWNYDVAVELSNSGDILMTDLIKQNFVEGSIVKMLINGETYICTVHEMFFTFYVGNASLTPLTGEDTGEPFAIWFDGMSTIYYTSNNSDIVNFAIDITVPKPIPGQYLPTGDNCPYVEKSDFNISDYNKFYAQKNELLKWVEIAIIGKNSNNTISIGNFDTVGHSEKLAHIAVPENISICGNQYENKSNVPYIQFSLKAGNDAVYDCTCKVPMTLVYDYTIGSNTHDISRRKFTGNFITQEYYLFALVLDVEETRAAGTTTTTTTTTMTLKRIV